MKEFVIPVFVYVLAEDASCAHEIALSALDGIDSWNALVDSEILAEDADVLPIGAVFIGNLDEVREVASAEPTYTTSHAGMLDGN